MDQRELHQLLINLHMHAEYNLQQNGYILEDWIVLRASATEKLKMVAAARILRIVTLIGCHTGPWAITFAYCKY
jgi:hypothetical protein